VRYIPGLLSLARNAESFAWSRCLSCLACLAKGISGHNCVSSENQTGVGGKSLGHTSPVHPQDQSPSSEKVAPRTHHGPLILDRSRSVNTSSLNPSTPHQCCCFSFATVFFSTNPSNLIEQNTPPKNSAPTQSQNTPLLTSTECLLNLAGTNQANSAP
jgi:hypothetical protein